MKSEKNPQQGARPRTLLFSHQNISEQMVWRCPSLEFQQVIQKVDSVELLAPKAKSWYREGKRVALRLGEFVNLPINPGVPEIVLSRDYEMFFTVCSSVSDLLHLTAVRGWRERCKIKVCWLIEFYAKDISIYKSCMGVLNEFDFVFFGCSGSEPLKKLTKGQAHFLPGAVDTLGFSPYPQPPKRSIDVLSIGRRAPIIHKSLLQMAKEDGKFYVYDTINALKAFDLNEHRSLLANMAKRSRYFIVSPGKFDKPEETGGQSEFGHRYFEAAAPGAIMIGMRCANNPEFDKIFNWEDAVIEVPFTSDAIIDVIRELDKQPERQMRIRQTNMLQALLHHDWVHRWESVLSMVGLPSLPELQERKACIRHLAEVVKNASTEP